jgi:short-subunit dehydrogenase
VLVARSADKLQRLANELGNAHAFAVDLGVVGAAQRVVDEVARLGLEVDVLINNAGFGLHGRFDALTLEQQRAEIDLNVTALFELTRLFLPTIERRQGGVILVASVAAYLPTPYMSVYGATKAFVLSLGEALWAEYRERGVRVLTLSPGQTDTGFFARAGEGLKQLKKAAPQDVVRLGLAAFEAGRPSVVHGVQNRLATWLLRLFPRATTAKLSERISRPSQELARAG